MVRLDPINRVLAVIDRAVDVEGLPAALARAGVPREDIEVLVGPQDADRIDPAGRTGGRWLRLTRIVALTQADQSVDLATYEAALRDGRAVVAVRASGDLRQRTVAALRDAGAHFVNRYGRWVTEEIVPWRGERLPLPPFLQR